MGQAEQHVGSMDEDVIGFDRSMGNSMKDDWFTGK